MKSEDRHKMQRNELADWLAKSIEQAKPFSKLVSLLVILVLLLCVAAVWWTRQAAGRQALAWAEYDRAVATGDPKNLEVVGDNHPDTEVAQWAAVAAADTYLGAGCEALFSNKSEASESLQDAVNHYRNVQEKARTPELLERAGFGLARAYEALVGLRGDLNRATEAYQQVVDQWPDGIYGRMAAERLEDLGREETKAFYDKFAAQLDQQPAAPDTPGTGSAGAPPSFDVNTLPDEPTFPAVPVLEATEETGADQPPAEDEASMPVEPEATAPAPSGESSQPEGSPPKDPDAPEDAGASDPAETGEASGPKP